MPHPSSTISIVRLLVQGAEPLRLWDLRLN